MAGGFYELNDKWRTKSEFSLSDFSMPYSCQVFTLYTGKRESQKPFFLAKPQSRKGNSTDYLFFASLRLLYNYFYLPDNMIIISRRVSQSFPQSSAEPFSIISSAKLCE